MFDAGKTRMIGLPHGEKIDNMLSRFIQYRNITNGRMDGWTNGQNCYINIAIKT